MARAENDRKANRKFERFLVTVQERVQQQAGLKDSAFYSISTATAIEMVSPDTGENVVDEKKVIRDTTSCWHFCTPSCCRRNPHKGPKECRHGQYNTSLPGKAGKCPQGQDNFHSPSNPDEYIRWRLIPEMNFYQMRIPRYAFLRRLFQGILLCSAVVSAGLAALDEPSWTAIVASVSGAITAWQEFVGTAKKLERYSTVAHALGDILMWWQALPPVDQSIVSNVDRLVGQTEGLLVSEYRAWLSDAESAAERAKAAADETEGKKGEAQGKQQGQQNQQGKKE